MGARHMSITGVVLARRETSGGFERLDILTASHGLLHCMRRLGKRQEQTLPDLFDGCECELESRGGDACFVVEYTVSRRRQGIGASYPALREASAWARLVLANAPHMESTAPLHALTVQALDAWETGRHPEAVHLKVLYLLGRDEGLPVKEQWLRELPPPDRARAQEVLATPLGDLDEEAVGTGALVGSLRSWLANQHHLVDPQM